MHHFLGFVLAKYDLGAFRAGGDCQWVLAVREGLLPAASVPCSFLMRLGQVKSKVGWAGILLVVLAVWAAGCARSHRANSVGSATSLALSSKPPRFIDGPMVVLLTNAHGYGGHVAMETQSSSNRVGLVSGQLLGRSNQLLFVPDPDAAGGKRMRGSNPSFIWDVAANRGFLLNEALQGYAPITAHILATKVTVKPVTDHRAVEKIDGHPCEPSEVTVTSSDGTETTFQVWRATDLKGFPYRIRSTAGSMSLTLSFSNLHMELPPKDLFLPPSDFTQYKSVEDLTNELLVRQMNSVRPPTSRNIGSEIDEGRGDRRY